MSKLSWNTDEAISPHFVNTKPFCGWILIASGITDVTACVPGDTKESAAPVAATSSPSPPPEVTVPPEVVPPPRGQESITVLEGDDVTLTLHIAGGEPDDIYW